MRLGWPSPFPNALSNGGCAVGTVSPAVLVPDPCPPPPLLPPQAAASSDAAASTRVIFRRGVRRVGAVCIFLSLPGSGILIVRLPRRDRERLVRLPGEAHLRR